MTRAALHAMQLELWPVTDVITVTVVMVDGPNLVSTW